MALICTVPDVYLSLLNCIRRDSTVQSLTIQPTIVNGQVKYEDSPLLIAVQQGHVLVVDEADKAPTYVTCILKVSKNIFIGPSYLVDGLVLVKSVFYQVFAELFVG